MKKLALFIGILLAANILFAQDEQEMMNLKLEEYKERMNLNEDQLAKWKEIKKTYRPQLKEIRDNESMERSDKMRAAADVVEKMDNEMKLILNEEQYKELQEIREEMKAEAKERRKD